MNRYAVWYCNILAKPVIAGSDTIEEVKEKIYAADDEWRFELDMKDYDECEIRLSLIYQE